MHRTDFAVITPLAEEWLAVKAHLQDPVDVEGENPTVTGNIGPYSVALRMPFQVGGYSAAMLVTETVASFAPRWVVLAGIAGGFSDAGVSVGDVVVASKIYPYEYGKVAGGQFQRRDAFDVAPDPTWLARAKLAVADKGIHPRWTSLIKVTRPDGKQRSRSRLHQGPVASGEKVIDDATYEFFQQAKSNLPELLAIEMEAAGAATTIELARAKQQVGFLMIRGISDAPRSANDESPSKELLGRAQRDKWKQYAAAAAAGFLEFLLTRKGGPHPISRQKDDGMDGIRDDLGTGTDGQAQVAASGHVVLSGDQPASALENRPVDHPQARVLGSAPPPTRVFLGRDEVVNQIRQIVATSERSPPLVAVTGLSGMGKTQLCRQYIDRFRGNYQTVIWASGENEAAALADLACLTGNLVVKTTEGGPSHRQPLQEAHDWFARSESWLLVIDNTTPLVAATIAPAVGRGHILVSSIDPTWTSITGNRVALEGLSLEWGTAFLLERTGSSQTDAAQRICQAFEGLPLALEQAAAYISTTSVSMVDYEALLEKHRTELLHLRSEFTSYPRSVYAAFEINVDAASNRSVVAKPLLTLLSYMAPRDFPRGLAFRSLEVLLAQHDEALSIIEFDQAVASLARSSLLTPSPTGLSSHSLVQTYVQDSLTDVEKERWSAFCVEVLTRSFPHDTENSASWPDCESLVEHVLGFSRRASRSVWQDDYAVATFTNAGSYLHLRGRNQQAHELQTQVLRWARLMYGANATQTALACNNLIDIMADVTSFDEALALGEEGIAILESRAAPTRDERISLGKMYSNVGRILLYATRKNLSAATLDRAEGLFRNALVIHDDLLGRTHYTTAVDINNLGTLFREKGEWHEARGHFADAVTLHRQVLHADDYRLAIALYNYGQASFNLYDYWDAEAALRESVRIFEGIGGGADRWDYNESLFGLGITLQRLGRHREALLWLAKSISLGSDLAGAESVMVQSAVEFYGSVAALAVAPWVLHRVRWTEGGVREPMAYLGRRPVESVYPSRIHLFLRTGQWIKPREFDDKREKGMVGQYLERQSRLQRDRRLAL